MLRRRIIQGADALALTAAATRVTVASAASAESGVADAPGPNSWKSVPHGAGGFVAGIVFHQREKGLLYARTSAGGAYRFDPATNAWGPLLDQLSRSDADLGGSAGAQGTGERLVVDPHLSDTLYLGTTRDRLMKSTDRGASFSKSLARIRWNTTPSISRRAAAASSWASPRLDAVPNRLGALAPRSLRFQ